MQIRILLSPDLIHLKLNGLRDFLSILLSVLKQVLG
jgi:hypothetical protein